MSADQAENDVLRHLLADLYGTRIVDVEDAYVQDLRRLVRKHGFMLVRQTGVLS